MSTGALSDARQRIDLAAGATLAIACCIAWLALIGDPKGDQLSNLLLLLPSIAAMLVAAVVFASGWSGLTSRHVVFVLVTSIFIVCLSLSPHASDEHELQWQNWLKLAVWVTIPVLAVFRSNRILPMLREPTVALAAANGLIALVSTGWSQEPGYTSVYAIGWIAYLVLALLTISTLGAEQTFRVMALSAASLIVLALAAAVALPTVAWMAPEGSETSYRLQGLASHPNDLGQQCVLGFVLTMIACKRRLISWWIGFPVFICAVVALILSESRTALLAMVASGAIVMLRSRRGLLLMAVLGGVSIASLILFVMATGSESPLAALITPFSRSGSAAEISTLTGRTDIWSTVLDLIQQRPLFGWGYDGTRTLIADHIERGFEGDPAHSHNMYLQLVLSVGLLGAIPGFGIFAILIGRMFLRPDGARDWITLLFLVLGFGEPGVFAPPNFAILVFLVFLAREAKHKPGETSQ